MNSAADASRSSVLLFGDRRVPGPLTELTAHRVASAAEVDAAVQRCRRLIVLGSDADLAMVLTRLLRTNRLDVEVGYAARWPTAATRAYRLRTGRPGARRARFGAARRMPLIRDETGTVIVGAACWLPAATLPKLHGEAVVDDTMLFDGDVAGVRIEPTAALPGLRAAVLAGRMRPRRWVYGRAAQLGSTGGAVIRDSVPAARPARRSAFYRNIEGWLLVG